LTAKEYLAIIVKMIQGDALWLRQKRSFIAQAAAMKRPNGRADAVPAANGIPSRSLSKKPDP
jgi:hypothetical protein